MEHENQEKSRTQIKKEYKEVQNLGAELAKLSKQQLKAMDLPIDLLEALDEAKNIKSKPAAQRHKNHIGSLMKNVDPEPIRQALKLISAGKPVESVETKERQLWVEKFLTGDGSVIEEFLDAYPEVERQTLRQLVKNAIKEKEAEKIGKSRKSLKALKKLIIKCLSPK